MDHSLAIARRDVLKGAGMLLVAIGMPRISAAQEVSGGWPQVIPNIALDSYISIGADGRVTVFSGRLELGTGVQTALSQIVAEELDVAFDQITMVMGDTDKTPSQGRTSASDTIQVWGTSFRRAGAEARRFLVERAAEKLGIPADGLRVENGIVFSKIDPAKRVSFGDLIGSKRFELEVSPEVTLKQPADYKIVGKRIPRVDIPGKATAAPVFVHDVRRPGMVHARVIRPPYPGIERQLISSLLSVDESSVSSIPGLIKVVKIADFVAVVTEREEQAVRAARALKVTWKPWAEVPDHVQLEKTIRDHPVRKTRTLRNEGDVEAAIAKLSKPIKATYVWPYQLHGSIGPSCAVAEIVDGKLTIWSATRDPNSLRRQAAALLDMPVEKVRIAWREGSGSYGRNCTDDATLDAALLTREIGRPVRVQITREQEHGWEPKGAAQLIDISGGVDEEGKIVAYDVVTKFMGGQEGDGMTPFLAGQKKLSFAARESGDRNAAPPYSVENVRLVCHDVDPAIRTSLLRGVASLPNSFAHECFMDEMAVAAGADPAEFRLRHLTDPRAAALMKAMLEKAGWETRASRKVQSGDIVTGRGVSYARYTHGGFPGHGAAYTAWVAEVQADLSTGQVRITRVVVAQDCGLIINPTGCEQQIRGNVIQAVSRVMREEVTFNQSGVTSSDWSNYPIATFVDIPQIDIVLIDRPDQPPLGVGESAIVPSAGAIANAIYDATGVRLRRVPFTPNRVKLAFNEQLSKNG